VAGLRIVGGLCRELKRGKLRVGDEVSFEDYLLLVGLRAAYTRGAHGFQTHGRPATPGSNIGVPLCILYGGLWWWAMLV